MSRPGKCFTNCCRIMIKAGVIGALNDQSRQLVTLLLHHPDVELCWVSMNSGIKGEEYDLVRLWPHLAGETQLVTVAEPDVEEVDVVFVADILALHRLPQDISAIEGLKVINLSCENMVNDSSYVCGLPEMNRKHLVRGCNHAVCPDPLLHILVLPLLPLARNLLLAGDIHVAVMAQDAVRIGMNDDNVQNATAMLAGIQNSYNGSVFVTPILGQQSDVTVAVFVMECHTPIEMLKELYDKYFDDHHFTFVIDSRHDEAEVKGTNKCFITLNRQGDKLVVTASIDNRFKGSAGNAVHVMNLLFGLHERVGLMM